MFFVADDGIQGRELWCWHEAGDASGECSLVVDLWPGPTSSDPEHLTPVGANLFFSAETRETGREPWMWDSLSGTVRIVDDVALGSRSSNLTPVGSTDTKFFFMTEVRPFERQLWVSEFSENAGVTTALLAPVSGMAAIQLSPGMSHSGTVLFCAEQDLWESDGTAEGTRKVSLITDGSPLLGDFCPIRGRTIFGGQDGQHGRELRVTDCTIEGTRLVKDIRPGPSSSDVRAPCRHGEAAYFCADDGEHGAELWRTDGTQEGTVLVRDVALGRAASEPHYLTSAGRLLYFVADDGVHGKELWRSDGTREGTQLVKDLTPGLPGTDSWSLTAFHELLFFCAGTPDYGEEVWYTDGTPEGTSILADITPGSDDTGPNQLTVVGDRLFFTCDEPRYGEELWVSDGSSAGTGLAADIRHPRYNPSSSPRQLVSAGGQLFFVGRDREHGQEIWTSDGTEEGTVPVGDIALGTLDADPQDLTPVDGRGPSAPYLFFTADNEQFGRELWCCSTTEGSAGLVSDIRPGPEGSDIELMSHAQGAVYFVADDGEHGRELWWSDGSTQSTRLVLDATPGPTGTAITNVFTYQGRSCFYVQASNGAVTLWRCGLAGQGAEPVIVIPDMPNSWDPPQLSATVDLRRVEPNGGITQDDVFVALMLYPRARTAAEQRLAQAENVTFFTAQGEACGAEIWRTEGTHTTTRLVRDAYPGPASSAPSSLVVVGTSLYFIAEHPSAGRALWCSDGTALGTHCVRPWGGGAERWPEVKARDLAPLGDALIVSAPRPVGRPPGLEELSILQGGPDVSLDSLCSAGSPRQLTSTGDRVFFTADDGVHGVELWVTDGTREGTHMVRDLLGFAKLTPLAE